MAGLALHGEGWRVRGWRARLGRLRAGSDEKLDELLKLLPKLMK